jgi:hypothetical protein
VFQFSCWEVRRSTLGHFQTLELDRFQIGCWEIKAGLPVSANRRRGHFQIYARATSRSKLGRFQTLELGHFQIGARPLPVRLLGNVIALAALASLVLAAIKYKACAARAMPNRSIKT